MIVFHNIDEIEAVLGNIYIDNVYPEYQYTVGTHDEVYYFFYRNPGSTRTSTFRIDIGYNYNISLFNKTEYLKEARSHWALEANPIFK